MFTPGLVKKKAHVTFSDFYLRLNQTRPDWSVRALIYDVSVFQEVVWLKS